MTGDAWAQAVAAINATSWLQVAWDKTGACTLIYAQNASYVGPVAP